MFGRGMSGQRMQPRQRVVAGHALQGRRRRRAQGLQLFQQMAAVARIGVQLVRAFGQAAQPRLHAKRCLHRGQEVEGVADATALGAAHHGRCIRTGRCRCRLVPCRRRGRDVIEHGCRRSDRLRLRRGQTRFLYSLVRVSISILSPVATNKGTGISSPVASLAGFITLPEVSPLTAGSV